MFGAHPSCEGHCVASGTQRILFCYDATLDVKCRVTPPGAVPGLAEGSQQAAAGCGGGGSLRDLERFGVLEQLWLPWPSGVGPEGPGAGEAALSPHGGHRALLHGPQCLAETGR